MRQQSALTPRMASEQLIRALPSGSLITVTAAAGFGKTTLLRGWERTSVIPSVVITLDPRHNDPAVLLGSVARVVFKVVPSMNERLVPAGARAEADLGSLKARLATALADRPLLLMFDDVHQLVLPAAASAMAGVLNACHGVGVTVLCGRRMPSIRLDRPPQLSRALTAEHLRLQVGDVSSALQGRASIQEMINETNGWPVLVTAWREATSSSNSSSPMLPLGYLEREVYGDLPAHLAGLLRAAATVGPADATMLARLVHVDLTQMMSWLDVLGRLALPLVRVDASANPALDFHPLARSVLTRELRAFDRLSWVSHLVDAAAIHQEESRFAEAFECLNALGDRGRLATFVADCGPRVALAGRGDLVHDWLARFDVTSMVEHPRLALVAAAVGLADGDMDLAKVWLNDALRLLALQGGDDAISPAILTAALGFLEDDPSPESQPQPLMTGGRAGDALGLVRTLRRVVEQGVDRSDAVLGSDQTVGSEPVLTALCRATEAFIAFRQGDVGLAQRLIEIARSCPVTSDSLPLMVHVDAVAALVLAAINDANSGVLLAQGRAALGRLKGSLAWARGWWACLLAEAALISGQHDVTESMLVDARALATRCRSTQALSAMVLTLETKLAHSHDRFASTVLTAAELAVLRMLDSVKPANAIGADMGISVTTVRSHTRSIYRKLGVNRRSDAVAQGRVLALI